MNTLFESDRALRPSFFQRHFHGDQTNSRLVFDVVFGIAAPIFCFVFDPIVFQSLFWGKPLLGEYRLLVYFASAVQILFLACFLLAGKQLAGSRVFGGVLSSGGLFSLLIGIGLLPFSLMGLVVWGLGIFGFVPFVTAITYFRNGLRAFKSESGISNFNVGTVLVCGALWTSLPVLLHVGVKQLSENSLRAIVDGTPQQQEIAMTQMKWLTTWAFEDSDQLVTLYFQESDRERKERIKTAYSKITGEDIEDRAGFLDD